MIHEANETTTRVSRKFTSLKIGKGCVAASTQYDNSTTMAQWQEVTCDQMSRIKSEKEREAPTQRSQPTLPCYLFFCFFFPFSQSSVRWLRVKDGETDSWGWQIACTAQIACHSKGHVSAEFWKKQNKTEENKKRKKRTQTFSLPLYKNSVATKV